MAEASTAQVKFSLHVPHRPKHQTFPEVRFLTTNYSHETLICGPLPNLRKPEWPLIDRAHRHAR
jgi:hypothetical protein